MQQNNLNRGFTETYERRFKSPIFSFSNSAAIAAGAFVLFDYHRDNTATEKYGSFNNLRVVNTSQSLIIVYPNQDRNQGIPVASGTSELITEEAFTSTSSVLIENADASSSVSANEIRIQIWKNKTESGVLLANAHNFIFNEDRSGLDKIRDFITSSKKQRSVI